MLESLWWLLFGLLLGWVGWFVFDKKFRRDGDTAGIAEPGLGAVDTTELEDQLAEAQADLQAYAAELTRVTDELTAANDANQKSAEQIAGLEKSVARLEREARLASRSARERARADTDDDDEPGERAGARRPQAARLAEVPARPAAVAPVLTPTMRPLSPAPLAPKPGPGDHTPAAAPAKPDSQGHQDGGPKASAPPDLGAVTPSTLAVPPPLPPQTRVLSSLRAVPAHDDAGPTAEPSGDATSADTAMTRLRAER